MRINDNRTVLPQGTTLHGTSCSYTIIKMLGQGTFGITYIASTSYFHFLWRERGGERIFYA